MKKISTSLFVLTGLLSVLLFLSLPQQVFGLSVRPANQLSDHPYPGYTGDSSLLGQNHSYSVFLRGNGESVVSFKAQFTNVNSLAMNSVRYTLPKGLTIKDVHAYQITNGNPNPCYPDYYNGMEKPTIQPMPATDSSSPASPASEMPVVSDTMLYQPCYTPMYYGYGSNYEKANYRIEGDTVTIDLPIAVSPNQTVNFFLSFRTFGYVKKNIFNTFMYSFETLKSEDSIQSLQVGLSAEQDYHLKDEKGSINYQETVVSSPVMPSFDNAAGIRNQEFDTFVSRIGQGTVYKYKNSLAPNESYTVKGMYADTKWKLYLKEVLIGLVIFEVFALLITLAVRNLPSLFHNRHVHAATGKISSVQQNILLALGVSFVSALCVVGYTILLFAMNTFFTYYSDLQMIMSLLLLIVSFGIYLFCIFVPAIIMLVKRGVVWGITTFGLTIMWLAVFAVLLFIFMFASQRNYYPTFSAPAMMDSQSTSGEAGISG